MKRTKYYEDKQESPFNKGAGTRRMTGGSLKDHKGITLIALIITIIVMLILVAVTITMAVNGGLFEYAGRAGKETQNALNKEQELAVGKITIDGKNYASVDDYLKGNSMGSWYYCVSKTDKTKSNSVTNYVTDGTVNPIEIGSIVNNYTAGNYTYTPTEDWEYTRWTNADGYIQDELQTLSLGRWLILGVGEDGCLELVSENPTSASNVTNNYVLGLKGQDGYTKGTEELNNICNRLYGKGNGAKGARSINENDIEKIATFNKTEYADGDCGIKYGDEVRLWMTKPDGEDDYYLFFNVDNFDMDTWESANEEEMCYTKTDDSDNIWYSAGSTSFTYYDEKSNEWKELGENETTKLTYTYYYFNLSNVISNDVLKTALLKGTDSSNDSYWVASPAVRFEGYDAHFRIRCVRVGGINADYLYHSDGGEFRNCYGLRPVVSLKSEAELSKVAGEENTYKIAN